MQNNRELTMESMHHLFNQAQLSLFLVNLDGSILKKYGYAQFQLEAELNSIYQIVDNHSKNRLEKILKDEKKEGTTDIYLLSSTHPAAFFLTYVKEQDLVWLFILPYPPEYSQMVSNMLDANAELTKLYEQKIQLEYELKHHMKELEKLSITDPLTGLYNRQYFYDYVNEKLESRDSWQMLSLVMIDFNDFKKVNDQYGHKTGDYLLKEFAHIIQSQCDMAFRFGGDEFVVVSVDLSHDVIKKRLDHINRLFSQKTEIVSLSYGISSISKDKAGQIGTNQDIDHYLRLADQAMYRYKQAYKNNSKEMD
ncbi:diguanylate cyclase (GGDEF) domain-containing protein [Pelagirhabdus alkalitolerans]|uniref:Diguanylate cyclase (GGDEF) domain-containing protein n=1 Tax=Pelagirhabdus alkalitolerans TaxID=1612202 RepID=A0A1G6MRR7_9BACI|nr:GGDEF domain-containing protein [Pelagirhabdus alkalitolerans]SDC58212.1 diguanylate cyclase (GGDEF) domain-containing protein [Pelagirhabdus alkalitolerans]